MRNVKLLVVLLAFLALPVAASGQMFSNANFGLFGGLAMPMGEFGDDDGEDEESGFAGMGFMIGGDMLLPLGTTPLGWVTSVSLNSFSIDGDEIAESLGGDEGDLGRYLLVPIMTGVSYPIAMGPGMSLVPMGQIGLNLAFGPSGDIDGTDVTAEMSMSLAFSAGATLTFTENLGVTARYVNGGTPERTIDVEDFEDLERDSPMSFVQLGVAWYLH